MNRRREIRWNYVAMYVAMIVVGIALLVVSSR